MWKLWRIGKIFGVDLKMHGTWVVMLALYALSAYFSSGLAAAVLSLVLSLVLFGVIVLHELGHIVAFQHFGARAKDIILTPLGGIARGVGLPKSPREELIVAAAGPAVNAVLAGLALAALQLAPWSALGQAGPWTVLLTGWFMKINLGLLLFNLIPALPMDGGRMLRAVLTTRMGYLRATTTAARVARWATALMALYAIFTGSFNLFFIAAMIFVMSSLELAQAHVGAVTGNPVFRIFQAASRGPAAPGRPHGFGSVVDQHGRPVGATSGGWSSAEHVQPTADGRGWTVQSVRWLED
jgi:Zn-dependent protease